MVPRRLAPVEFDEADVRNVVAEMTVQSLDEHWWDTGPSFLLGPFAPENIHTIRAGDEINGIAQQ